MKKIFEKVGNHLNFRFHFTTGIELLVALLILPCIMFLPEKWGWENGILENLQLVVLAFGFIIALTSKVNKKFFIFVALIITILALREVNCGRTIFFPVPGIENTFYKWKEIKYGYLAHPLYGLYMAIVGIYFLKNKLFIDLWEMVKKIKFPIWDIMFLIIGMGLGTYAEECMHNFVAEEITELLFYVALVGIIWLYSRHKDFQN